MLDHKRPGALRESLAPENFDAHGRQRVGLSSLSDSTPELWHPIMQLRCQVNGEQIEADVAPRMLLSDFIRHELRLTGTNVGCEMGVCGACTVIVDGDPVRSCLMFAVQVDGCVLRTVESLAGDGPLNVVQRAFHEYQALQCGYCTPGILMTVQALLDRGALPSTEQDVREALSGNICRCTGYQNIVDAVLALAR